MSRRDLWLLGAAVGMVAVLASLLMFLAAVAVALLVIPLARKRGGLAAVSGLFTGFGGLWVLLMVRASVSNGTVNNAPFWVAVGAVPLTFGLALTVWIVIAASPRRNAPS